MRWFWIWLKCVCGFIGVVMGIGLCIIIVCVGCGGVMI